MKENMSREIAMRLYKVFTPLCYKQDIHIIYLFSVPVTAVHFLFLLSFYARLDFRMEMEFACLLVFQDRKV